MAQMIGAARLSEGAARLSSGVRHGSVSDGAWLSSGCSVVQLGAAWLSEGAAWLSSGCSVAQLGCGMAQCRLRRDSVEGCSVAQLIGCGVAQ